MNTPLGAKGKKAQDSQDAIDARFRKRYGVANHEPGTPAHLNALKKAHNAIKSFAGSRGTLKAAAATLGASGRTQAFG